MWRRPSRTGTPAESSGGWQGASFDKSDVLSVAATNCSNCSNLAVAQSPHRHGRAEPAVQARSLKVQHELEFGGLHDGQVARFFALENAPDAAGCLRRVEADKDGIGPAGAFPSTT